MNQQRKDFDLTLLFLLPAPLVCFYSLQLSSSDMLIGSH